LIEHAISLRNSGGTQRIAVFRAFADTVAHGEDQFVVIDTAPTGQTPLPRHIIASSAPVARASSPERLSVFERYLSRWVGLCMVVDVVLRLTIFRAFEVAAVT
jgi:hypothetical protein